MDLGRKKEIFLSIAILIAGARFGRSQAAVVINEIMQSNLWEAMDETDEFPDSYVELYNESDEDADIRGWRIGEKKDFDKCYKLPNLKIAAKGHALILCDKEAKKMHTDFRLDSGKGSVYLYNEKGEIVSTLKYAKMPAPNIAYGRERDGAEKWGYMLKPTPGRSNEGGVTDKIAPSVRFSEEGGIWTEGTREPFYLTLTPDDEEYNDSTIRYTTDGTEPTEKSPRYTKPIRIEKSTAVKAKVFASGCATRPASVESYIWHPRDVHMAAVSLVTDPKYFYGEKGLYTLNSVEWKGSKARRPMNLEYFPKEGRKGQRRLNQICEGNIGGYTSAWNYKLKTLVVRANKRFGEAKFANQFWRNQKPKIKEVKSMTLRATNLLWDMMREPLVLQSANKYGIDYQAHDPILVYLNAKPYGFMWLYERTNEDYVEANYGTEDVDMVKYVDKHHPEITHGDDREWNRFLEFQKTEHTLEEWKGMIDVDAYAVYMIIESFVVNVDFMNNNTLYFRKRGDGNVWKPLLFDIEAMMHSDYMKGGFLELLYNDIILGNSWIKEEEKEELKRLWRGLLKNGEFRELFVNRAVAMGGDCLRMNYLMRHYFEIRGEIGEEVRANGEMYDLENLRGGVGFDIVKRLRTRSESFPREIRNFFKLGEEVCVAINPDGGEETRLTYDGLPLHNHSFCGTDYAGRRMTVGAKIEDTDDGEISWVRMVRYDGNVVIDYPKGGEISMVIPEGARKIVLTPISGEGSDGDGVRVFGIRNFLSAERVTVSDMLGRTVYEGAPRGLREIGRGFYVVWADGEVGKVLIR